MEAGASTATILFTDLVGSTALRGRLGDDAAEELRRRHDVLVREALEGHRGRVVKGLGDGVMAEFSGAADALAAAVAVQQALERHNRRSDPASRLEVRVGLAAGDVTVEDGDCFGTPVIEAARLCAAAPGSRIYASEVVRALAGSRGGHHFTSLGALELKGLDTPLLAVEVDWAPETPRRPAFPPGLDVAGAFTFVGRAEEGEVLIHAWKEAVAGNRRILLVGGEPGVGKTRLVAEMARTVHGEGALVLYGRCDEELGVAYGPFAEALGTYAASCSPEDLLRQAGALGGELVRLVPALATTVPGLPDVLQAEPGTERYRLLEAVREFLAGVAADAPLLLVLDDLHWADKPTLVMLRHLLRTVPSARLLVVGTYRDTDLSRTHPLSETLADLRREPGVGRLSLIGLAAGEVAAFLEAAAGHALDEEGQALARAVHAETEGNPFFVGEVLRHLTQTGAVAREEGRWVTRRPLHQIGIPEGVREVIGRRLARLPAGGDEVLGVASVIGREFDAALVVAVGPAAQDQVLDTLEAAERARLVSAVAGRPGRYGFAHALVRSTLYDELPTSRRLRLHRAVGNALESRDGSVAELAHHFCEAATLDEVGRAVRYSVAAGEEARTGLAFEQAAAHFERALEALEVADRPEPAQRCDLLIALGDARRHAGDRSYREVLFSAAEIARTASDANRLAEAALTMNLGVWSAFGRVESDVVALIEEALAGIGNDDPAVRARLLAVLAIELAWGPESERRAAAARQAVALAREVGDTRTLAYALVMGRRAIHAPDNLDERLAMGREGLEVARVSGDPVVVPWAHLWLHGDFTESAARGDARRMLEATEALAQQLRVPTLVWFARLIEGVDALLDGRLEEAEAILPQHLALGRDHAPGAQTGESAHLGQLFVLRYEQGRLSELENVVIEAMARQPDVPFWPASLAMLLTDAGRHDEAARIMADPSLELDRVARDVFWFRMMITLATVHAGLGDAERCAALHDALRPYRGRLSWSGFGSLGPVDRALGLAAAACGRHEEAAAHFSDAIAICLQTGTPTWLARARCEWALVLAGQGDPERSRELARLALAAADDLGMAGVSRQARELLGRG